MSSISFGAVCVPLWCWQQKTSFCVNSLPFTSEALAVVQPNTFLRWHHQGFRLFWRWQSTPGRPPIPANLQALIRRMARENPTWGQERIADELLLKLGLRVSPRTVRKYMSERVGHGRGPHISSQRWRTFVRNHATAIIACDFCAVVTATFRLLIRLCRHRARDSSHRTYQCAGTPHCLMDTATAARSHPGRSYLSFPPP